MHHRAKLPLPRRCSSCPACSTLNIEVAPKTVKLMQVEGGPLALAKVSIRSTSPDVQNWTVTATTGRSQRPVDSIGLHGRHDPRPAHRRTGRLARGSQEGGQICLPASPFRSGSAAITPCPWSWKFAAANPPPAFSYLAGPTGCRRPLATPIHPYASRFRFPAFPGRPSPAATYVDPNFGGRVRVMTAAPIYHTYSTPSPLSAHKKYLMSLSRERHLGYCRCRHRPRRFPPQSRQSELLLGCQ